MRPALPGLLLLAAAGAASCGGSSEKKALLAYEAAVEDLMAEDGKVSAHLKEIRQDLEVANLASDAETRFARDEAVPFYKRFQEKAAAVATADPRLADVHGVLTEYLDQRLRYLEATEAFLDLARSEEIRSWEALQDPWQKAQRELGERAGGNLSDREVVDAIGTGQMFLQRLLDPFLRGQVARAEVERGLRQEVLPRLARIVERTRASTAAEGLDGAIARWAQAEHAFFDRLASTLPKQEALQRSALASSDAWEKAGELREKYLKSLATYTESLR